MDLGGRYAGITVLPEYIQTEGVDGVLASLARAGASAVSISPYVMEPADAASGAREPPADAGSGKVRLLDRPLWGQRELFVRTAPSFAPERTRYAGLRYQPPAPTSLTERQGAAVARFIEAARERGLAVFHQVQAAIPPGYRVQFGGAEEDDLPRLPDGSVPGGRVDGNATLASPHIVDYGCALIADLLRAYPDVDGVRVDWPEFPPYTLDSVFLDFGVHAERAAVRLGLDFEAMREQAAALRAWLLGGLGAGDLERASGQAPGALADDLARRFPALEDWLAMKATLATELVARYRDALRAAGGEDKALIANLFPAPWCLVSGARPERLAGVADALGVKLYTMHWPMMARHYVDALHAANPALERAALARLVAHLLDVLDGEAPAEFSYPEPDRPHGAGPGAQVRKVEAAIRAAGDTPVMALAHGYGPVADFEARLRIAWRAANGRVWVNRYGYLADPKLDAIGRVCR